MEQPSDYSIFPEKEVTYASFWQRFAASFIDGLIMIVPTIIFRAMGSSGGVLNLAVQWLYFALQESGPQQATIGKKAMGIKVTDLNGNRITFGQATGRYFGKLVSAVILFIGYFMMLWDDKSQALHDKMSGCLVVQN